MLKATADVQVRSQALLQDKYRHIRSGCEGHMADMKAALTQIVSTACIFGQLLHMLS